MARGKYPGLGLKKRNNRWGVEARVNGRAYWVGTFDTLAEATTAGYERRQAILDGHEKADNPTISVFLDGFVDEYRPNIKFSTRTQYEGNIRRIQQGDWGMVTVPAAKGVPLKNWRMGDVSRTMVMQLARLNGTLAKFLAPVFQEAYNDGLIPVTHFAKMGLDSAPGRKDIVPVTQEEVFLLADCATAVHGTGDFGQRVRALVLFQAFVANRPGEAFALRRMDLHPGQREVTFSQSSFEGRVDATKTYATRRVVVPDMAWDALAALPVRPADHLIFTNTRGKAFRKESWYRCWNPIRERWDAKLDPRRKALMDEARGKDRYGRQKKFDLYELRHFGATWLLNMGVSVEDVAFQLGHADSKLVERLYGHPDESLIRDRLRMAANAATRPVGNLMGSKVANG